MMTIHTNYKHYSILATCTLVIGTTSLSFVEPFYNDDCTHRLQAL